MGVKTFLLKRLPFCKMKKKEKHEMSVTSPMQYVPHVDLSVDCDTASVGSGNSNFSTGTLQNIREQMAMSLERMKDLEEQVKVIPMLQVQVSVLKEEKRNLQKQVGNFVRSQIPDDLMDKQIKNEFFSIKNNSGRSINISTREMGTMCGIMTRDVGVSHQPVRTRDIGMVTSTPIQPANRLAEFQTLHINEVDLDGKKSFITLPTNSQNTSSLNDREYTSSLSRLSYSNDLDNYMSPELKTKSLNRSYIKVENIYPNFKKFKDISTNTEKPQFKKLSKSRCHSEEIISESPKKYDIKGTETVLSMHNIHTSDDISQIIDDSIKMYCKSIETKTSTKGIQCTLGMPKVKSMKNQEIQATEPLKMRLNIGISAKPKTTDVGINVKYSPERKSIAVGPDPISIQTISLNSLNSLNYRSKSFNYGDNTISKKRTTKSIGLTVDGLLKTSTKMTDTFGLAPKLREFGTSPMKKKFVDVSVGDSLKPHIAISCAANYCDNCKETIKTLAKQMSNNNENNYKNCDDQITNIVSKIPRPAHITLNNSDLRRQLKRQDTYTKIPIGIICYDADNKESYNVKNELETLETDEICDGEKEPKKNCSSEKKINADERASLPESALFEPIHDKSHSKQEPSKEMRAAMKVLNDNLKKSPCKNISHQTKNATNVIQQEWFKISSTVVANPHDVEDYLDCFEEYSNFLLEFIVNMTDSSGNTAMHYAVSHGNFDVVSILLDSKVCDINKTNAAGYTAVMLAALAEVRNSTHLSVANRLFQLADVNIRAKLHGQTALMLAVSHGRKDMTRLLLDAGAAVNIQDEDGSTALMCAAEHGHTEIVKLLLTNTDCDSSILDIDGSSALKIALEAGNRDIGVLLYAHEHVNRGTSPYSSMRRSRRGSKSTTPTTSSPSTPVSPALSKRFQTSNSSLITSRHSAKNQKKTE
ncbi:hypothetical protein PV327_008537 [Microctonus hyperodae]|uniref:KN motif and ankyrin repeat domain-containing protein 2 n=2 Tax=Microctonus hyperodae TaxID=165561 RepID=A0AA39F3C9_MICHY|nr:hypothetical protein PV327_008537 [Microctonus hyperodae]